jgi:hypothetical protein
MATILPLLFGVGRHRTASKTWRNPPFDIGRSPLFHVPWHMQQIVPAGVFVLASRRMLHLRILLLFVPLVRPVVVTIARPVTIASAASSLDKSNSSWVMEDGLLSARHWKLERYAVYAQIATSFSLWARNLLPVSRATMG